MPNNNQNQSQTNQPNKQAANNPANPQNKNAGQQAQPGRNPQDQK